MLAFYYISNKVVKCKELVCTSLESNTRKRRTETPELTQGFWVGDYSEWLEGRLTNIKQAYDDNDNVSDIEFMEIVVENTWDT